MNSSNPEYYRIHALLYHRLGPAPLCVFCGITKGKKRFEWANVSGEYTLNIEDYLPLCCSCHRKFDYTEEQRQKMSTRAKTMTHRRKAVKQLDKDGNLVKTHLSSHHAAQELGILKTSICNNLKGLSKTSGGYKWEYA